MVGAAVKGEQACASFFGLFSYPTNSEELFKMKTQLLFLQACACTQTTQ